MGVRGELFSTKVALQNRTYFFNIKENRLGDLYLNIVESKNKETGGFERQSVILFAEDLQEFLIGFDESLKVMEKAVREKKRGPRGVSGPGTEHKTESPWQDERPARPPRDRDEGPRPRTSRRDSEGPRPWAGRGDGEGPRPRTTRRDGEGSPPRDRSERPRSGVARRRDSEGPKSWAGRRDGESPRPRAGRRDRDDEGPKPWAGRSREGGGSEREAPRRRTFRKEGEDSSSRPRRNRPSERSEDKPKRRVVRKRD